MRPSLFSRVVVLLLVACSIFPATSQVRESWTVRYRDPEGYKDTPQGLALVPDGVVTVGLSQYRDGLNQIVVLKYGVDGRPLWQVPYRSGRSNYTYDVRVAGNGLGDVFIATFTATNRYIDGSQILALLRVDSEGHVSTLARLGPALAARPSGLKVEATGYLLVHGTLGTSTGTVYQTTKFDPSGRLLWSQHYAGPARQDRAGQIITDAQGNVYVTGRSPGANQINDIATLKYAPDGTRLWLRRYAAADPLASDSGNDLALDADNNLYVAGGGNLGFVTLRYSAEGDQSWMATRTNEWGNSPATFIALDGGGNALVAGTTASLDHGPDWRLIKYDSEGRTLWQRDYSGAGAYSDGVGGMVVEPSGVAYLTGTSQTNGSSRALLSTARYSPNGDEVWRIEHGQTVSAYGEGQGLVLDGSGDLYVVATARGADQRDDLVLVKYRQARSAAEFLSIGIDEDGLFAADLFAESGHEYTLEASTDLQEWTPVQRVFNENGYVKFTAPVSGTTPRFYRAVR